MKTSCRIAVFALACMSAAPLSAADSAAGPDHEAVKARYDRGRELARDGRQAEALAEYLWCFDEGMPKVPSYTGVRLSFLLSEIERMGRTYTPAWEALETRCDAAEKRLFADAADRAVGAEFAALCSVLKHEERLLAAFDKLPGGDPRRAAMGFRIYKLLREKGRYADALEALPYRVMALQFDGASKRVPVNDRMAELDRRMLIDQGLDHIEVLAGAGALDQAREMIGKLVAYDGTEATKGRLAERLTRVGQPGLYKKE